MQIDELEALSVAGLNYALLHALFRSMQLSSRRGCHTTAASLSSVVLGLCPEQDPKRALLCIDYFAIKAGRIDWLLGFLQTSTTPVRACLLGRPRRIWQIVYLIRCLEIDGLIES
jgi:hypothetical protein